MTTRQTASVTPTFDETAGLESVGITMELDPGFTAFGQFRVRHYPSVNSKLRTDIGSVTKEGTFVEVIDREAVRWSGNTAQPSRPVDTLLGISSSFFFDEDGNGVSPSIVKDGFGLRTADGERVFGMSVISYRTTYLRMLYTGQINGTVVTLGSILAFFNGNVTIFDVPPGEFDDEGEHLEIYRIVSEMVVNENGAFEKPEDWVPGDDTSPTFPGGEPDPTLPSVIVERVHEIGSITNPEDNALIRVRRRCFYIPVEEPFVGSAQAPERRIKLVQPNANGPTQDQLSAPGVQSAINEATNRANS